MNTILKPLTGLTCLMLLAGNALYAQKTESSKEENIIIRKKGNADEKMTIVIDGETVTVNGKPVDQYKDSAFDIHRFKRGEAITLADGFHNRGRILTPRVFTVPSEGTRQMFMSNPNRAFLGVMTEKDTKGAKITEVTPESAAAKAGLQKDDIITGINDDKIADMDDLVKAIGKYKPEEHVQINYLRDGTEATATATLGKSPQQQSFLLKDGEDFHFDIPEIQTMPGMPPFAEGKAFSLRYNRSPRLGLQVQDVEEGKGVKVLSAADGLPAAKAGIQKEDIITAVNGKSVNAVEELKEQLNGLKEGDTVELNYLRNNKKQSVQIKLPKKLQTSNL